MAQEGHFDRSMPFWSLKFDKLLGQYFRHLLAFFIAFTVLSIAAFILLSLIGVVILEAIFESRLFEVFEPSVERFDGGATFGLGFRD